ncbi:DUF3311 domain-containing protein [Bacillus sp. EB600]|uniref:DUF3311 domain-containing protein n=1 Tax=Bacillus sp. EB600 TaxID=2806345 RepID=UPI00210A7D40|nr:DUF3311 domain-containing protein [Bacillus sp. EB600]MCQ6279983.1 DUF3311 domain-containing protein [Bacillus sp. EB600]
MKYIKLLLCIPFIGIILMLPLANRIEPYVLGMPFLLFWLSFCMVLSSIILLIIYKLDPDNKRGDIQ